MLHLSSKDLAIVQGILKKYPYQFYAYGSRVKGTEKKLSDLDLCYKEDIPANIVSHIREDFENSDLPFTVDLTAWKHFSDSFKQRIEKDLFKV